MATKAQLFSGRWVANLAKSARHANHQFKSAALDIVVDGHTVTITHSGVNAGGQQESGTVVLQADGREHAASPQAPDVVTISRWAGERRLETVASRGESVIGNQIYAVSPDGNTLTATVSGIDASGRSFEQVIVFDRQ